MKRTIFLLFTLVVFSLCLCACHGNIEQETFEIPESFDTNKEYEITFWAKNDTNLYQKAAYNHAIEEFEKLYPNIHVHIEHETDYTTIYNNVLNNLTTNTTPNVCITYPDYVATFKQRENVVVNLDNLISDNKYGLGGSDIRFESVKREEVVEKFLNECVLDGSYYCMPFIRSSEATYINKDLVESLGYTIPDVLTWDWVWEVCKKSIEGQDRSKQNKFFPLIYKSTDNMFIQMAKQYGIDYTTENGEILLFNEDTKNLLMDLYEYAKDETFQTFKNVSYPGNHFNKGNCIFAIDSTAGATWMGTHAPNSDIHQSEVATFETVVRGVPQKDASNIKMISQGPSLCIFNKEDPQEVLATWLFVQYLLTNDVQLEYTSTEGYVPVTYKAINSDEYKDYLSKSGQDNNTYYDVKIEASKLVIDNITNTFTTPAFKGSSLVRSASGSLIEEIFKPRYKNTEEYINGFYDNLKTLYKLDELGGVSEKMPATSIMLLVGLAIVWVGIGSYYFISKKKNKKTA